MQKFSRGFYPKRVQPVRPVSGVGADGQRGELSLALVHHLRRDVRGKRQKLLQALRV